MAARGPDGVLREWGTRLFYGMPKKAKRTAEMGLPQRGSKLMTASSVRAQLRQVVKPGASQVMVKITGGGRGMKAIAAHMRYISRLGDPEVGGKGKSLELEDENRNVLSGRDAIRDLGEDWRLAGSRIDPVSHRREAFNVMLSMPKGTPPSSVRDAAREFARETFAGHKYVFALHTDTDSPHVHLAIRAERSDGIRLNPKKADLHQWRLRFAKRLQEQGIDAVAMRAWTRGVTKRTPELWQQQAQSDGRMRKPPQPAINSDTASRLRSDALEAWKMIATALATSPDRKDNDLAVDVVSYVASQFEGRGLDKTPSIQKPRDISGPVRE